MKLKAKRETGVVETKEETPKLKGRRSVGGNDWKFQRKLREIMAWPEWRKSNLRLVWPETIENERERETESHEVRREFVVCGRGRQHELEAKKKRKEKITY